MILDSRDFPAIGERFKPHKEHDIMRHRLIGASLLLATFILLPNLGAQAPGKKGGPPAVDSDKLKTGEFLGTLKSVPGTDRQFKVEVQTNQLVPIGRRVIRGASPNHILSLQNQLLNAQKQLAKAKKPSQRNSAMRKVANLQLRLNAAVASALSSGTIPAGYRVNVLKNTIEFQAMETVKVRTTVLPEQFDDKGNVKKFTKKELDELKGKDKNLPGYESSLEKLEAGQIVKVSLAQAKKAPAKGPDKNDKDNDKDQDKDDGEKKMQVKLIVIQKEVPNTDNPRGKKGN
jgi:hypothetical protein